jgi:hypothetical protein
VFANRAGDRLFGVLDSPASPVGGLGVILLSPGVKMRVGPHRLYLRLVDLSLRLRLPVLRFDFYGLGDSEGTLDEQLMRDVYNHIEVGRFVGDTLAAMDWMERHHGINRFILCGLCGGAVTGLLAGSRDSRVVGLLALGITPVLASRAADPGLYMTVGQLERLKRGYLSKLTSPRSWLRLLSFKSDYRVIWKALTVGQRASPAARPSPVAEDDNASPLFPPAFMSMLSSRRPMLLVFGGSDRLAWEFEEKFVARHREALAKLPALYDVHVVPQANHVLSQEEWQKETVEVSTSWLLKRFSQDLGGQEAQAGPEGQGTQPAPRASNDVEEVRA